MSGARGEHRGNALWGRSGRRACIALAVLACALAAAAGATAGGGKAGGADALKLKAYVQPSLVGAIQQSPSQSFDVIVQGDPRGKSSGLLKRVQQDTSGTGDDVSAAQVHAQFRSIDGLHATLTGSQILRLARRGSVAAILPNETVRSSSVALPVSNGQKWAWSTGVPVDWTTPALGLSAPTIAIVDSGIDATRPDVAGRVLGQVNLASLTPNSPGDGYGHGTFVAGIAAGAADGFAGVAPAANLLALDVMDDAGEATVSDVVSACDWILANKDAYNIRVANFSLHGANRASVFFDPLDQAVEKLWLSGVVVVAASGNYGVDGQPAEVSFAPGNDPFVITVGAADVLNTIGTGDDVAAPWSAWGHTADGFAKPELSAPGRYMIGPVPTSSGLAAARPERVVSANYMQLSGTSFAAPVVSGAAALLLAQHPAWTPDQVKGALMLSADPTPSATVGSLGVGEVDVAAARKVTDPPNGNAALAPFLTADTNGAPVFDTAAWQSTASTDAAWASAAWSSAAWASAAWSDAAWASAAWASAAWASAAWADAAWADAAWADAAWADGTFDDPSIDPNATAVTNAEMTHVENALGIVDATCDPTFGVCLTSSLLP